MNEKEKKLSSTRKEISRLSIRESRLKSKKDKSSEEWYELRGISAELDNLREKEERQKNE